MLGKPSQKKPVKLGKKSKPLLLPPSPFNLGTLNNYFFIAYLGFKDHEMDFEKLIFFPHKSVLILRKVSHMSLYFLYIPSVKMIQDISFLVSDLPP